MEQLGELIKALRKANKMTQQALAQQYGMSRATISGSKTTPLPKSACAKSKRSLTGLAMS